MGGEPNTYSDQDVDEIVDARDKALIAANARIMALENALRQVRSYNEDIHNGRINYRPLDHIAVIDRALK